MQRDPAPDGPRLLGERRPVGRQPRAVHDARGEQAPRRRGPARRGRRSRRPRPSEGRGAGGAAARRRGRRATATAATLRQPASSSPRPSRNPRRRPAASAAAPPPPAWRGRRPATARRRAAASAAAGRPGAPVVVQPRPRRSAYVPVTLGSDGSRLARRSRRGVEMVRRRSRPLPPRTKGEDGDQQYGRAQRSHPTRPGEPVRASAPGRPGRSAARDAAHARDRGARDEPLPPGQGAGILLRRLRPGGRVGRPDVCDGGAGQALRPAPRPRRAPRARRAARDDLQPVHGPRRRHHERSRRQRALRRLPHGLRRDGLDAARHDARRGGHGDGLQAARRAALRADVVRRRIDLARRLPRGDELGRRPAPAGHLRAREQPVRLLDADQAAVRRQPRRARRGVRLSRRVGRRQRRRGDVRGHPRGPRAGDRRRRADADRGRDDADARARRARRHEVRAQGARRGVAPQGPDRPPERAPGGARRRRGRAARRGARRGRRRRRGRPRGPDARSVDGDRPALSLARRRGDPPARRTRPVERLRRRRRRGEPATEPAP